MDETGAGPAVAAGVKKVIRFTKRESDAFQKLFDEIHPGVGACKEDRMADPAGKVLACFDAAAEALGFVERLVGLGFLRPVQARPTRHDPSGEASGTFDVMSPKWLEAVDVITVVEEPALRQQVRQLRAYVNERNAERARVERSKADLEQQLRQVNERLAAIDADTGTASQLIKSLEDQALQIAQLLGN